MMKQLYVLLTFVLPLSLYAQHAEIGALVGPYWSNRNILNQNNNAGVGVDLTHNFSEKSNIRAKFLYGESRFYENDYNDLLETTTPEKGTNTVTRDFQVALMYGRNFKVHEQININSAVGLSVIFYYNTDVAYLSSVTPDGRTYYFGVGGDSFDTVGFPFLVGGEFEASKRWSFSVEAGATFEPDYGLICVHVGPKVSLRLSPNTE